MVTLFTVGMVALSYLLQPFRLTLSAGAAPRFYDVILIGVILAAAVLVTRSTSRLATIAMLGSIGFSIAILFLLYSAPDLAMAQFAIEVLTVILFVLVLYRLPKFSRLSSRTVRLMDVVVAVLGGGLMTLLMLMVSMHNTQSVVAQFFVENSLPLAKGRNIVNVILVDFRGFDTLGEITVLAAAAIGVFSLIGLAVRRSKPRRIKKGGE